MWIKDDRETRLYHICIYLDAYAYVTGKTRNPAVREVPERFQANREVPKIFKVDREVPNRF